MYSEASIFFYLMFPIKMYALINGGFSVDRLTRFFEREDMRNWEYSITWGQIATPLIRFHRNSAHTKSSHRSHAQRYDYASWQTSVHIFKFKLRAAIYGTATGCSVVSRRLGTHFHRSHRRLHNPLWTVDLLFDQRRSWDRRGVPLNLMPIVWHLVIRPQQLESE